MIDSVIENNKTIQRVISVAYAPDAGGAMRFEAHFNIKLYLEPERKGKRKVQGHTDCVILRLFQGAGVPSLHGVGRSYISASEVRFDQVVGMKYALERALDNLEAAFLVPHGARPFRRLFWVELFERFGKPGKDGGK